MTGYFFDTTTVQESLYDYLGGWSIYYSIDGIIGDLHEWALVNDCKVTTIDDVNYDVFHDILMRRDLTNEDNWSVF